MTELYFYVLLCCGYCALYFVCINIGQSDEGNIHLCSSNRIVM
jgi:hypothetical protein